MTSSPTSSAALALPVDSIELFESLAKEMNAHPEIYQELGWCDMDFGVIMRRDASTPFAVALHLREYGCEQVTLFESGGNQHLDCWLVGDLDHWQAVFDDIAENGMATGEQTLSSLVLLADRIAVKGHDAMGVDLFFRYNQTLQSIFDGAAALATARQGEGS
ncbi:MAG: hypothetical protein HYR89_00120 [Actinobacteria bacterium]|nr:hypothetical protein [Actinomycetota bacterium]MBI3257269.1 hypothetical protein [Actinomycetota bacterium]